MAQTFTSLKKITAGNERIEIFHVEAGASASGAVDTTCGYIEAATIHPLSCASVGFGIIVKPNLAENGSTTRNGSVFISSTTTGDDFYLVCYGRA